MGSRTIAWISTGDWVFFIQQTLENKSTNLCHVTAVYQHVDNWVVTEISILDIDVNISSQLIYRQKMSHISSSYVLLHPPGNISHLPDYTDMSRKSWHIIWRWKVIKLTMRWNFILDSNYHRRFHHHPFHLLRVIKELLAHRQLNIESIRL